MGAKSIPNVFSTVLAIEMVEKWCSWFTTGNVQRFEAEFLLGLFSELW